MKNNIAKSSVTFLKELKDNNNREWFKAHKSEYDTARQNIIDFADELIHELNKGDVIETSSGKKAIFRIYRDVRFSKDKTPYNVHWSAAFGRASAARRGSYYFRIKPGGESGVGGGFYGPNPADMKLIRSHFEQEPERLRKIINAKRFKDTFGQLEGEQVKTAPRGYAKDHPAIDLLKYKQFVAFRRFSDKEILSDDFAKEIIKTYKAIRPFFDYMSEILTTNLNGESLLH